MEFIVNSANNGSDLAGMQVGKANIKVIGVGGAGNNAVNWLYKKGIDGAEIIACNTDLQHLNMIEADKKFLIGKEKTRGLGAGGYPNVGMESAEEAMPQIKEAVRNADMVFICSGMGGGTGTGAAPVVAKAAKEVGAIVIGAVTMPFKIERARIDKAEFGLAQLRQHTHTVIVIDNNRLVQIAGNLPVNQAFAVANELVATMIKGIVETIALPSLVNLDFADVKAVMTQGELASIGYGVSDTNNRVQEAVHGALSNPLLDINYEGSTGAIIQITGGHDMTLEDINQVGELVTQSMDENATVIWGARVEDSMKGKIAVMTIITGVTSSYVVGPATQKQQAHARQQLSSELGIEVLR